MIGAAVYELRAKNSARLPFINGRLMHAAFFKILHEVLPELENFIHEKLNIKPFTVSFLNPRKDLPNFEERWEVGLNENILRAIMAVPIGYELQAGNLILSVEDIQSKILTAEDFISSVKELSPATEIDFEFLTPVSFRIDNFDAPYPRAELIFASLADKWTQVQMPAAVDKKFIREVAAQIRLTEWRGRSRKFYSGSDRGILAFWGNFRYNLSALDSDFKKVFMLLAKFAEYAGVGRLSAQGLGQTRVIFR